MASFFDMLSQFPGDSAYAVNGWLGEWKAKPIVVPIEPWWAPGTLTHVSSGAKLVTRANVPIHSPGLEGWEGAFTFAENTGLFLSVRRGMWQKGTKVNVFKQAEFDLGDFSMSPSTMAIELGNNPGKMLVGILNGCYSGTPEDAAGNVIGKGGVPFPWLTATDQIYGGNLAVLSSGTKKLVNPADPTFEPGNAWYNCHQNLAITGPNIITVLQNQQTRKAMNGIELGIGDEGVELWVPHSSKEQARVLVEVMRQLAGTGVITADLRNYQVDTGGSPQTNQQVVFGTQDNPVFGRVKVRAIHGMRSDLWCIVSPPPQAGPEYSLFLYAHGGNVGEYGVQTDPAALMADTVPHIAVFPWTQASPMFFGVPGVSQAGDVGLSMILNEGFAAASGLLIDFAFTGAAS